MAEYNLGTAQGKVVIDASGVTTGLAQAKAATEGFEGSQKKTNAALTGAAVAAGGAGLAIVGAFGYAVKTAADFEAQLSAVAAVSGATAGELDQMRQKALDLGAETSFSASEAALAMEELIKAGLGIPDVMNGAADATVALAAAGGTALPVAAEIAANSMNQFGLEAEKMPKVADLIAGAANASAISVEDFGMSVSQAGAVANLAGFSFEDTATAIALMGNAGIKGSDAGTSLKTMLMNLQPTTNAQVDAFQQLGLITEEGTSAFYDQEGQVKSLTEISWLLAEGTKDMTEAEKTMALEMAFGSDAIRAAAVFANEGAAGVNNMTEAMGKVTAAEVAAKRLDNFRGSMDALGGSLETLVIKIGTPLQNALKGVVEALTGVVDWIANLSPETLTLVTNIGLLVAGLLLLVSGLAAGFLAFQKVKGVLAAMKVALAANPWVLIVAAIAALVAGLIYAYNNFEGFRKVVDSVARTLADILGPILASVGSWVSNAADQLKNLFNMFKSGEGDSQGFAEILDNIFGNTGKLIPLFRSLYEAVVTVFEWISGTAVPAVQDLIARMGGMDNIVATVVGALQSLGSVLLTVLKGAWESVLKPFITFLIANIPTAVAVIRTIITSIVWLAREVIERLGSAFTWIRTNVFPVFGALAELVAAAVQRIIDTWNLLRPAFDFIIGLIQTVLAPAFALAFEGIQAAFQIFVDIVTSLWRNFGDNILNAFTIAWDLIRGVVQGALEIIKGIIQTVTGVISGDWGKVWDGIKSIVEGVWTIIRTIVQTGIDTVKNVIDGALSAIRTAWDVAWSTIKNVLQGIWDAIKRVVGDSLNGVVSFFSEFPGKVTNALGNLLTLLLQKGKDLVSGLFNGAKEIAENLITWVGYIPNRIVTAIGNLGKLLYDIGRDVIQGLINGLKDKLGDLMGVVGDIAGKVKSGVGNLLGINSPSKVMFEMGAWTTEGFINGLRSMLPTLAKTAELFGDPLLSAPTSSAPLSHAGVGTTINLNFNGQFGPGAREAVTGAIEDTDLIDRLITTVKAGR